MLLEHPLSALLNNIFIFDLTPLASIYWAVATTRRDEKHLSFGIILEGWRFITITYGAVTTACLQVLQFITHLKGFLGLCPFQ